jgi:DNA polymerase-3 subunit gamma/tau
MRQQAAAFGPGELSRAADIVNTGLSEMTGATGPRLQLELICARVLLPAVSGEQGYAARLDRLERRMDIGGAPATTAGRRETTTGADAALGEPASGDGVARSRADSNAEERRETTTAPPEAAASTADARRADPTDEPRGEATPPPAQQPTSQETPAEPAAPTPNVPTGAVTTDAVRRAWPDVLERIARAKRVTWTLLSQHAHVADFDGETLTLGTSSPGLAAAVERPPHPDVVAAALYDALGIRARVTARPDSGAPAPNLPPEPDNPPSSEPTGDRREPPGDSAPPAESGPPPVGPPQARDSSAPRDAMTRPPRDASPEASRRSRAAEALAQAGLSASAGATDSGGGWGAVNAPPPEWATAENPAAPTKSESRQSEKPREDEITESMDDEDVDDPGQVGLPVMQAVLGATVIDEQVD